MTKSSGPGRSPTDRPVIPVRAADRSEPMPATMASQPKAGLCVRISQPTGPMNDHGALDRRLVRLAAEEGR